MRRDSALIPLSHDHHQGLILAQMMRKNAPVYTSLPNDLDGKVKHALKAYKEELVPHFENEEKILFPAVNGISEKLDKLIEVILTEHTLLHEIFNKLEINKNPDILDRAGEVLEQHIRLEERELFQLIQEVVPKKILESLEGKIDTVKKDCDLRS
ncbi:MAG: hypothetical protein SCALA702_02950 [Melioribacteraceae bacterium]|nr:MAG: hypothetical protein SCALA702_02950 [Melioribacteraceae bacterium]